MSLEDRRAVEGQLELVAVEHLQDQHLVAQEPQPVQAVVDGVQVGEQVGDDHQEAPAADAVGERPEQAAELGLAGRGARLEQLRHHRDLRLGRARGQDRAGRLVEEDEADRVLLAGQEHGQRDDQGGGVVELATARPAPR